MANKSRKAAFSDLDEAQQASRGDDHARAVRRTIPSASSAYSASAGDILLDYSKNRIDEQAMEALFDLARDGRASKSGATRCGRASTSTSPKTAP